MTVAGATEYVAVLATGGETTMVAEEAPRFGALRVFEEARFEIDQRLIRDHRFEINEIDSI